MNKTLKSLSFLVVALILVGVAFVGGVAWGFQSRAETAPAEVNLDDFWRVWNLLDERFVSSATSSAAVTNEQKLWGAISGLVDSFDDPYTVFLPPEENKSFKEEVSGRFGGVGMEVGARDRMLTIIAPLPGTPAAAAGLKAGDKILSIDGQAAAEMSVSEAISKIRGDIGTKVKLSILRGASSADQTTFDVTLTRARIEVPTMETELLPEKIFLIKLFNFGGTSERQFRTALSEFVRSKTDKLILDLRGNPGGYLDAAVDIASWFLPADQVVVREERRDGESKVYKSDDRGLFNDKLKMVVLVDEGSASASEILAGALREHGVATLIGTKTFGKGSVQELVPISSDTALKVTVARWLTPKGISISHDGLDPDMVVEAATSTADSAPDRPLEAAIDFLLGRKR